MPRPRTPLAERSGPWSGYYIQHKRKRAMELALTFDAGRVSGRGRDWIDAFTIDGTYSDETGAVSFVKKYPGRTGVNYRGAWSGQMIRGRWSFTTVPQGTFRLEPAARQGDAR